MRKLSVTRFEIGTSHLAKKYEPAIQKAGGTLVRCGSRWYADFPCPRSDSDMKAVLATVQLILDHYPQSYTDRKTGHNAVMFYLSNPLPLVNPTVWLRSEESVALAYEKFCFAVRREIALQEGTKLDLLLIEEEELLKSLAKIRAEMEALRGR